MRQRSPKDTFLSTEYLYDGLPQDIKSLLQGPSGVNPQGTAQRSFQRKTRSRIFLMASLSKVKLALILIWIWTIFWGEHRSFSRSVSNCQWERWEKWPQDAHPHHVALIADPQLVDPHTYPDRPWPLSVLTIRHTDQYLRRAFSAILRLSRPDTTLFLGDLFDGGREWATAKSKSTKPEWKRFGQRTWLREYTRFERIFVELWRRRPSQDFSKFEQKFIASLPGNHDLGFGNNIQLPVRTRFTTFFGNGNRVDMIGNHSFVSIDSVSLSASKQFEDTHKPIDEKIAEPTEEFLRQVGTLKRQALNRELRRRYSLGDNSLLRHGVFPLDDVGHQDPWIDQTEHGKGEVPTILLTHVPLYRDPGTPCGPLREKWPPSKSYQVGDPTTSDMANAIAVSFGEQYQNVLHPDISKDVLEKVGNVKHIFSGDDHDYCEVVHKDPVKDGNGVREITVKSISWAMGIRKPGFVLLSLWNPIDSEGRPLGTSSNRDQETLGSTIQTHLCLLPDQLGIFIRYGILLAITLGTLVARAIVVTFQTNKPSSKTEDSLLPLSNPSSPLPEPAVQTSKSTLSTSNAADGSAEGLASRSAAGRSRGLSWSKLSSSDQEEPWEYSSFENGGMSENFSAQAFGTLSPGKSPLFRPAEGSRVHSPFKPSFFKASAAGRPRVRRILFIYEVVKGVVQVAVFPLMCYAWLAYTV